MSSFVNHEFLILNNVIQATQSPPLSIVVLISGGGSNLQSLIDAIKNHRLNAKICAVISNKANIFGLERAKKAQIPTHIIDHKCYVNRQQFDQELTRCINFYQPQLIVLAGFMRILTEEFVTHFSAKMINIHPSLLPKYRGLNTHQRALKSGDSRHGLTIHYVSAELDGGPIILQKSVAILANDNETTLAERVLKEEHIAYPKVIQWFAQNRLQLVNNKIIWNKPLK
jgi:phosphoribosylglycinamide formyltransferase-1